MKVLLDKGISPLIRPGIKRQGQYYLEIGSTVIGRRFF